MDRAEEALDHDQVLAVRDPREVEELELLPEPRRELVFSLPFGKVLGRPDPAAGVRDEPFLHVVDRDADPPRHDALVAVPEAELLDEPGRDAPLGKVRVLVTRYEELPAGVTWLLGNRRLTATLRVG